MCSQVLELAKVDMKKLGRGSDATSAQIFVESPHENSAFQQISEAMREGLINLKKGAFFERTKWLHCMIGVTAWYRQLSEDDKTRAGAYINALRADLQAMLSLECMELEVQWNMISAEMEAQHEFKAVEYAMREVQREQPLGLLAGGTGSVQITGLDTYISFQAPLRKGTQLIANSSSSLEVALEEWKESVRRALNGTSSNPLIGLMSKAARQAQEDGPSIMVVIISAFYYAAIKAEIVEPGDCTRDSNNMVSADQACEKLLKLIKKPDADPKDVANAARLHEILHQLFGSEDGMYMASVNCTFARDWKLDEDVYFRTTWASGWWIDYLLREYRLQTMPANVQKPSIT